MENDLDRRVKREIESYQGGLEREHYNDMLSHCGYFSDKERARIISKIIKHGENKKILELGSTLWYAWLELFDMTKPKELECINISERELEEGRKLAKISKLKPNFQIMDAHNLTFPEKSFDVVYGGAILHHLEYEKALQQVSKVLKDDGYFVFVEPLRLNPVAMLVRALTPKARTEDEKPLAYREIKLLNKYFQTELHFEQLLAVPVGVISRFIFKSPDNILNKAAFIIDKLLVRIFPFLGLYYRSVIITGKIAK